MFVYFETPDKSRNQIIWSSTGRNGPPSRAWSFVRVKASLEVAVSEIVEGHVPVQDEICQRRGEHDLCITWLENRCFADG